VDFNALTASLAGSFKARSDCTAVDRSWRQICWLRFRGLRLGTSKPLSRYLVIVTTEVRRTDNSRPLRR
jgi:hypothetical protein